MEHVGDVVPDGSNGNDALPAELTTKPSVREASGNDGRGMMITRGHCTDQISPNAPRRRAFIRPRARSGPPLERGTITQPSITSFV